MTPFGSPLPDFVSRPVLLYGPRKAGTSLLHNLLDGSGELLMLPGELKLTARIREGALLPRFTRRYLLSGRLDFPRLLQLRSNHEARVKDDFHFEGLSQQQTCELFDVEAYVASLGALLEEETADYRALVQYDVAAFANALRTPQQYSCWAAKEVGGHPQAVTGFFKQQFPEGKIIGLVRNPLFVVRSIILDRKRKGITLGMRQSWLECAKAQSVLDFFAQQNCCDLIVTYEELTRDTSGQMERVANVIGIPFEPILTRPTALGVPVVVRTSSQRTTVVFQQGKDWRLGLRKPQIAAMKLFFGAGRVLNRRRGRPGCSYDELLQKLETADSPG